MSMQVAIAYVFPAIQPAKYWGLAQRFVTTWQQFPPGYPASLTVFVNGGQSGPSVQNLFAPLTSDLRARDNSGWDIGAFQEAAETIPCDLLVCLGACVHFHRADWLDRMVSAYANYGPGLYGCAAYLTPNYHVRTTAFWCPPELLQSYPWTITSSRASRYGFEHLGNSFTRHVLKLGFPTTMVTWNGCHPFDQWEDHAPDKNGILVRDQHIF